MRVSPKSKKTKARRQVLGVDEKKLKNTTITKIKNPTKSFNIFSLYFMLGLLSPETAAGSNLALVVHSQIKQSDLDYLFREYFLKKKR